MESFVDREKPISASPEVVESHKKEQLGDRPKESNNEAKVSSVDNIRQSKLFQRDSSTV